MLAPVFQNSKEKDMTKVFVLRNQHGDYLTKQREWISAGDSKSLYRSAEKDEIINEKVELTVKSPDLRVTVVTATQEDNGRLSLDGESLIKKAEHVSDDAEEQSLLQDIEHNVNADTQACSE